VTSDFYDKQHVSTYMQPFSHRTSQERQNNVFHGRYPSLTPSFKRNLLTQKHEILSQKTRVFGAVHGEDTSLHRFDTDPECDRQTDRQTYRRPGAIARKNSSNLHVSKLISTKGSNARFDSTSSKRYQRQTNKRQPSNNVYIFFLSHVMNL